MDSLSGLSASQHALLRTWMPDSELVADHSWGLVATTVWEMVGPRGRVIVKAGGTDDHHISREIRAHRRWLQPWTRTGHAPELLAADEDAKLLMTRYLPGRLVEGHDAQATPDTYRQAGALLSRFHGQCAEVVHHWDDTLARRTLRWLDRPHQIGPAAEQALRAEIRGWDGDGEVSLVPTHGDWQPRNWLTDRGTVRVIDFGRADLRPAASDFARLARQDFARDPGLEAAFLDGYGNDPREEPLWRRTLVTEAVGTAVWAFGVGDESFERVGLRQITGLLS